jgi:uroporphyrinogen III methyltransferase/synthase
MKSTKEKLPLDGAMIGVTGTAKMAGKLSKRLEMEGASVLQYPYLRLESRADLLDKPLEQLQTYQWVVFTSSNAVRLFFGHLQVRRIDIRQLSHLKFAVIGSGTGEELQRFGIFPDFLPSEYTTKVLGTELVKVVGTKERMLIPRAKRGSKELTQILYSHNMLFDEVPFYDVVPDQGELQNFADHMKECEFVTFESSSGVDGFFGLDSKENAKERLSKVMPVCIGEGTADTLSKWGAGKMLVGNDNTIEGMVSVLKAYFSGKEHES